MKAVFQKWNLLFRDNHPITLLEEKVEEMGNTIIHWGVYLASIHTVV